MTTISRWLKLPELRKILDKIEDEKAKMEWELVQGVVLQHTDDHKAIRELALTRGKLDGIEMFLKLLEEESDESTE